MDVWESKKHLYRQMRDGEAKVEVANERRNRRIVPPPRVNLQGMEYQGKVQERLCILRVLRRTNNLSSEMQATARNHLQPNHRDFDHIK